MSWYDGYQVFVFFSPTEAADCFYMTRCEVESRKWRGKTDGIKINKRRHERIDRVGQWYLNLYLLSVI